MATLPPLDIDKVLQLLEAEGPISRRLKKFEVRHEQRQMLTKLIEAFNSNSIALIEAGTGTGKSLAYLIPALLAAVIWKEKVLISTHTIALQEQLIEKDLPILMEALGVDLKAVLVKGMGNYVCLRKFDDLEFEKKLLSFEQQDILTQIESLSQKGIGTKSDFPFNPPHTLWEMVGAEYETCTGAECPHYQQCFYIQARKNAQDAQLLIVNHHLLFSDLMVRAETQNYTASALLPAYSRLIIDEAHHLEAIATEYFAARFSRLDLLKTLSKLTSEKQGRAHGKLPLLKDKIHQQLSGDFSRSTSQLLNRLTIDLPALRRDLLKTLSEVFHLIEQFQQTNSSSSEINEEQKLRLRDHHYASKAWQEVIVPQANSLTSLLKRYSVELSRLEELIKELDHERLNEASKGLLHEIKAHAKRLLEEATQLEAFAQKPPSANSIRWIETTLTKGGANLTCVDAALQIADQLRKNLFSPFDSVALLSATLTTQGSFHYLRERMGLNSEKMGGRSVVEAIFDSPFDYQKQALLIIPKDIVPPTDPAFLSQAQELIWQAIQASQGNAFILFTSYGMLQKCYEALAERLKSNRYRALKQGDEGRQLLLKKFMENERSVLFGTDSFWEGVDVVGEALRLVIITKLPFKVPTEPMIQARSEAIEQEGGDPFYQLLLPQAAIKFKQGFGRLIRNKKDRGCILCLDNRLVNKKYGQYFLNTLPSCPRIIIESKALLETMRTFYKQTFYMTKN